MLIIFEFLGSNEKKPENKPATPLLEKYSEKITVSFGSAKEEKGKEPVKTTGPKEVSKPPEKDVEMIDLEPDKTKTKGPTPPPPATSQSKFNALRYIQCYSYMYLHTPVKSYVVKQPQEKWACDFHDDAPPLSFQLQIAEVIF